MSAAAGLGAVTYFSIQAAESRDFQAHVSIWSRASNAFFHHLALTLAKLLTQVWERCSAYHFPFQRKSP
jgi:hypothetical protein